MVKTKNYQNGKIYQIVDNTFSTCYIGSTIDTLNNRFCSHKSRYERYKQGLVNFTTVYKLFDDYYGVENCRILQLEAYPCQTREELNTREGYYIKNTECVNKYVAGRTTKEYKQHNKTDIEKSIIHEWKNNNKEPVKNTRKHIMKHIRERCKHIISNIIKQEEHFC